MRIRKDSCLGDVVVVVYLEQLDARKCKVVVECDYIELDPLFEIHPRKEKKSNHDIEMRLHRVRFVGQNTSKKRKAKERKEKKRNHNIESQPTAEFQITPSIRNPKTTKKVRKIIIHDKHLCWK